MNLMLGPGVRINGVALDMTVRAPHWTLLVNQVVDPKTACTESRYHYRVRTSYRNYTVDM